MDWINLIKPYTKRTIINHKDKSILLVHPHFEPGIKGYKMFLRSLKQNKYSGYRVEAVGFASIKGLLIIKSIEKYLKKFAIVEEINIRTDISSAIYRIRLKLK